MIRENPPVPRLRVFKDLDSDEVFIAEWYPTLEHGYQLRVWDEGFVDEGHAREYIKLTLYN